MRRTIELQFRIGVFENVEVVAEAEEIVVIDAQIGKVIVGRFVAAARRLWCRCCRCRRRRRRRKKNFNFFLIDRLCRLS